MIFFSSFSSSYIILFLLLMMSPKVLNIVILFFPSVLISMFFCLLNKNLKKSLRKIKYISNYLPISTLLNIYCCLQVPLFLFSSLSLFNSSGIYIYIGFKFDLEKKKNLGQQQQQQIDCCVHSLIN